MSVGNAFDATVLHGTKAQTTFDHKTEKQTRNIFYNVLGCTVGTIIMDVVAPCALLDVWNFGRFCIQCAQVISVISVLAGAVQSSVSVPTVYATKSHPTQLKLCTECPGPNPLLTRPSALGRVTATSSYQCAMCQL